MKSNVNGKSEDKIEKVTESLWKVWWFSFYLIIVPSLVSVIGFFIFFFIGKDLYASIGFSVITFMFTLLFFYKPFDKYRNRGCGSSMFETKYNHDYTYYWRRTSKKSRSWGLVLLTRLPEYGMQSYKGYKVNKFMVH